MKLSNCIAVIRNEVRILKRDQAMFWSLLGIPIILMIFIKPVYRATLQMEGYAAANGSEQAVPGMAVLSAFYIVGNVGFVFFREHAWGSWQRLRASPASMNEIVTGKVALLLFVCVLQQGLLFLFGTLVLGLKIKGSLIAIALLAFAFSLSLVTFGTAVAAAFSKIEHINIVQTAGTMIFAGLGGALTPIALLPDWAQALGKATPSYWAIKGYQAIILEGAGVRDVLIPIILLLAMTAVFACLAIRFFRAEEAKQFWT